MILTNKLVLKNVGLLVLFCSGFFIMVAAMLVDVQRAPIAALFISLCLFFLITFIGKPRCVIFPTLIVVICMVMFLPVIESSMHAIIHKTSLVGFNMRFQELFAVWGAVNQNPFTLLFGLGWAAEYESPAVGGLNVTFTHSLLSYMLLKTGIVGLVLTALYLVVFLRKNITIFCHDRVVGIAILWAFIIPIFLYASYKSLDYGLLLTLLMSLSMKQKRKMPKAA